MAAIGKEVLTNEEDQVAIADGLGSFPGEAGGPAPGSARERARERASEYFHNSFHNSLGEAFSDEEIAAAFDGGYANKS